MPNKEQTKVIYGNRGLANFYGDYIEINRKLKYNKVLRDYIVKHELGHSKSFDLKHEFEDGLKLIKKPNIFFSLVGFYIKNPSTWVDLIPLQIKGKQLVYDLNLLIFYGLIGLLVFISFKIF